MRQELDKLLSDSAQGKVKEIAGKLNTYENAVYREIDGRAKFNMLEKIIAFMDVSETDEIIERLAASQGGIFFRDVYRDNWKDFGFVQSMLKEFSELFAVVSDSLEDGVIDSQEESSINKEWCDFAGVMQSFKRAIERGEFSEQMRNKDEK